MNDIPSDLDINDAIITNRLTMALKPILPLKLSDEIEILKAKYRLQHGKVARKQRALSRSLDEDSKDDEWESMDEAEEKENLLVLEGRDAEGKE